MKTPMQEHIEWLKKEKDEYGYEKHPYFECAIEHAESMLEEEKEVMVGFAYKCRNLMAADEFAINHWYDKTFNTKER
jgi:hypothetical protein